jgi:protein SCO1
VGLAWLWGLPRSPGDGAAPLAARPGGGDFTLQAPNGPLSLHDLRGKVVLLYFGYTHCPDICPVSMSMGARALNLLTAEERARTRLLFVSVDPERDTPARIQEYTAYFHPEMLGATGTPEQLRAVAKAYGAAFVRQPPRENGGYAVDHSAQTYLIAPDGTLHSEIPYAAPAEQVIAGVRGLL